MKNLKRNGLVVNLNLQVRNFYIMNYVIPLTGGVLPDHTSLIENSEKLERWSFLSNYSKVHKYYNIISYMIDYNIPLFKKIMLDFSK